MSSPSICFVGLENLPALAAEYRRGTMGGAQLQQTLLAKALTRRGFRVSMVVADSGQPEGAEWFGIKTHKAYRRSAGIPVLRFVHPRWSGVWSAMRRAQADIYYVSCADMLVGEVALFGRRHAKRTVFRIAHDSDCEPDQLLIPNLRDKWLYRYGLRNVDLVLAQSAAQRGRMLTNFGRDSHVLASLKETAPEFVPLQHREIDAVWVSNIRPFKRPDLALDFAQAAPEIKLHVVGGTQPGTEDYYATIRARAQQLGNVTFHGPLPLEEVNLMIGRSRLLLNTSDSEGFPNTYLQAWSRGTPVVAFFDPDEVIARQHLGASVSSVAHMQSAVTALLRDASLWTQTSARCRDYVEATHGENAEHAYADALGAL